MDKIKIASAAILCGGKSRRMGFDKAFLQNQGEWLLKRNAECLKEVFEQVVLVSNSKEKLAAVEAFSEFSVLTDETPDCGPLGGIYTALSECRTPYIFVTACDMPVIHLPLVMKMYDQIDNSQVTVCVHGERMETLFAFYHQSCLPVFKEQLSKGRLQIRAEFIHLKVKPIILTPEEAGNAFININTPQELAHWEARRDERRE